MRNLQEYFRPSSPEEAHALKCQGGSGAAYLAGGSDVMVHRSTETTAVIDIRFAGLSGVRTENGGYYIGATTPLHDAEAEVRNVAGGMLREALRETAPWLIRNVATVAGNLANASPAADSVPALIALDAEVELLGAESRFVAAADILQSPHRTNLGNALIVGIRIPSDGAGRRGSFQKHSRSKSDIAQVNCAVTLRLDEGRARDVRVALGAVAPTAIRAGGAESVLEGQLLNEEVIALARDAAREEVRPISDWRASADYRRHISGVLVQRALRRIVEQKPSEGENEA